MLYALTDYGAKAARQLCDPDFPLPQGFSEAEAQVLKELFNLEELDPTEPDPSLLADLERRGIVRSEPVRADESPTERAERLRQRYRTGPLRHMGMLCLELTTHCNMTCAHHCHKGALPRITERDIPSLLCAIDQAKQMGIAYYVFIGGEVTLHGEGWLDVARHISGTGHPVELITNGWWGIDEELETAAGTYRGVERFVAEMKGAGVTRICFSVDGPPEQHDARRGMPGLYSRVLRAVEATRAGGITPAVSIVVHDGLQDREAFFKEMQRVFQLEHDPADLIERLELATETGVLIAEEMDIGNAVAPAERRRAAPYCLDDLSAVKGFCKGITRSMKLSIRANGEVETCTVGPLEKGIGNIHQEPLPTILNRMRGQELYRVFDQERFEEYAPYLHRDLFGERFFHKCTILALLAALVPQIDALRRRGALTDEAVREVNLRLARATGFVRDTDQR